MTEYIRLIANARSFKINAAKRIRGNTSVGYLYDVADIRVTDSDTRITSFGDTRSMGTYSFGTFPPMVLKANARRFYIVTPGRNKRDTVSELLYSVFDIRVIDNGDTRITSFADVRTLDTYVGGSMYPLALQANPRSFRINAPRVEKSNG
jgi:hypothetical protein